MRLDSLCSDLKLTNVRQLFMFFRIPIPTGVQWLEHHSKSRHSVRELVESLHYAKLRGLKTRDSFMMRIAEEEANGYLSEDLAEALCDYWKSRGAKKAAA